jgi:hypothetical protein
MSRCWISSLFSSLAVTKPNSTGRRQLDNADARGDGTSSRGKIHTIVAANRKTQKDGLTSPRKVTVKPVALSMNFGRLQTDIGQNRTWYFTTLSTVALVVVGMNIYVSAYAAAIFVLGLDFSGSTSETTQRPIYGYVGGLDKSGQGTFCDRLTQCRSSRSNFGKLL